MLAGLALLAGKDFTMENSETISVYQSPVGPSEFISYFDRKDIMRYMCKLDSLDIIGPCYASPYGITNKQKRDDQEKEK